MTKRGATQVRKKRDMQLHQEKTPKETKTHHREHGKRSTDDHDEKNELTFSANR